MQNLIKTKDMKLSIDSSYLNKLDIEFEKELNILKKEIQIFITHQVEK